MKTRKSGIRWEHKTKARFDQSKKERKIFKRFR